MHATTVTPCGSSQNDTGRAGAYTDASTLTKPGWESHVSSGAAIDDIEHESFGLLRHLRR